MKKLLIYLKDYKKETILAPLFKMLEAMFELFIPLVMASIIDIGIRNSDKNYVLKMCFVMILLGVIGLVCSIVAQYYSAKAAVGFGTKLRHGLFAHIQSLSFTEIDTIGTSTMITRITSDINQVQSGINLVLRLFLRSPVVVIGAMIMAFTINIKAAFIFVATIPLLSIVVFGIMKISIPLYTKVQGALDKVLAITRENLSGVRVIRAFHKEESEIEQFEKYNESLTKISMLVGRISALMNPITYVIVNGAIIALIWSGAIKVEMGIITQGALTALLNYMSQILIELIKLANLIITITKSIACGNRIQNIFEIKSSMLDNPLNTVKSGEIKNSLNNEIIVSFDNVSLTYKNARDESLTDINFDVKRGQTIGIIGGTGSGKSSLVNLIPRFYDVTKGKVLVDGIDVKEYSLKELRNKIGVVMQKAVLFKGSIRENLKWGNEDASDKEIMEALILSQSKEIIESKDKGLDFLISQAGKNLSGGQKQRLTIARALVRKPDILILDDSASALDYATDAKLRSSIKEMKEKPTVFIVSQRASSIMYADKIIVLDDGRVDGIGNHEELLNSCKVYQEIYYSQVQASM